MEDNYKERWPGLAPIPAITMNRLGPNQWVPWLSSPCSALEVGMPLVLVYPQTSCQLFDTLHAWSPTLRNKSRTMDRLWGCLFGRGHRNGQGAKWKSSPDTSTWQRPQSSLAVVNYSTATAGQAKRHALAGAVGWLLCGLFPSQQSQHHIYSVPCF